MMNSLEDYYFLRHDWVVSMYLIDFDDDWLVERIEQNFLHFENFLNQTEVFKRKTRLIFWFLKRKGFYLGKLFPTGVMVVELDLESLPNFRPDRSGPIP